MPPAAVPEIGYRDLSRMTPALMTECLEAAGEAEMRLRASGLRPALPRSCMPEPLREEGDADLSPVYSASLAAERLRWDPPTGAELDHRDEVYHRWVPLLAGNAWHHWRRRRLVLLRSLIWPDSDRLDAHVWSWRRLGEEARLHHETVRALHARAIDDLTAAVRRLPGPCLGTVQRMLAA